MLSKDSPEYRANGYYIVDGEDWMSIWTYKNRFGIEPNNTKVNGPEGLELYAKCASIESIPDFGKFDKVYLFKVTVLDQYFN